MIYKKIMADKDKDDQEKTIAEDLVVTKYKMAGEIANRKFQYIYTCKMQSTSCFHSFFFFLAF